MMGGAPDPHFLSVEQVLTLHRRSLERDGGLEGCRDRRLLESAVSLPQQSIGGEYLHADLAAMAAAYLFHIVSNHPFHDGNKRTGLLATVVFLSMNGCRINASLDELEKLVLGIAKSELPKDFIMEFMGRHVVVDD